jgi:hypothetical protein
MKLQSLTLSPLVKEVNVKVQKRNVMVVKAMV